MKKLSKIFTTLKHKLILVTEFCQLWHLLRYAAFIDCVSVGVCMILRKKQEKYFVYKAVGIWPQ